MRPSAVPILTILTFLGFVASMQPHHRAVFADRALIMARQGQNSGSRGSPAAPTGSSGSTTSTTTTSSTKTSASSTTSSTTSPEEPTTTSDTSTSFFDTSTTLQSSSSESTTTSRSRSTSSSSSSSVTPSDLTGTSLTLPTSPTSTFKSTGSDSTSFTFTVVVSRPSVSAANNGASATSKNSFFSNKGAVAGTFLVVGLFGTAFLLCAILWVLRKYRRRRNDQAYFDEEYKEFNHDRNGTTPEPTLPTARDSGFITPIPPSPAPNMIERLHGADQPPQNMYFNHAPGPYQRESGDFDPYKTHDATYGYSGDQANYAQYTHYAEHGQQESGAYAYEPQADAHASAPAEHQAVAGPSHVQQQSVDSFYDMQSSSRGPQAH